MIGPFDYHVFAHVEGRYQTAEMSAGVTATEKGTLEQFFFGQTNDEQYLSSLAREPGVIWRRCGERFLLTRVLAGARDANNRATLRFETILVRPPQAQAVIEHLGALIVSPWETRPDGAVIARLQQPAGRKLHPDVISDAVMAGRERKRFVRSVALVSLLDVQKIIQSLCDDDEFSLCHKSLNESAAATVNLIADVAKTRRAAVITTPKPKTAPLPQAPPPRAVATGLGAPVLILLSAVLIMQIVLVLVVLGVGGPAPVEETAQQVILDRIEVRSKDQVRKLSDVESAVLAANREAKRALETNITSVVESKAKTLDSSLTGAMDELKSDVKTQLDATKSGVLGAVNGHLRWEEHGQQQTLAGLTRQSSKDIKAIEKLVTEAIEDSKHVHAQLGAVKLLAGRINGLLEEIDKAFNKHRGERDERERGRIIGEIKRNFDELQKRVKELHDTMTGTDQAGERARGRD